MGEWQPIESAPEGEMILLADITAQHARDWAFVGWRHADLNPREVQIANGSRKTATHWMPLPGPPESGDND